MIEIKPSVVVVAYNRPRSLNRLLRSLKTASYPKEVKLIISIDRSDDNLDVLKIANDFIWDYGSKQVIYHETNLGLKKHILTCGELSLKYGSVIILEDDLFVSPDFYYYTIEALKFTNANDKIGGISLYNHQLNVHTGDNFSAIEDEYDNWYFQFASSWGQAWSKDQWQKFKIWLDVKENSYTTKKIPEYVLSWSEKSWLKLFIAYLITSNRFFIYPKTSLTTNFSDSGTHVIEDSTLFQVPLLYGNKRKFRFSELKDSMAVYDAFYENLRIPENLLLSKEDCCIDLYGYKPHTGEQYWLTPKILNMKVERSYGRSLKPIDANIFNGIEGNDFFLYDTKVSVKNTHKIDYTRRLYYNIKTISYLNAIRIVTSLTFKKNKKSN